MFYWDSPICISSGNFQELFFERVKIWQNWQGAQQNLTRKREMKARHELSGRADRANQILEELHGVRFFFHDSHLRVIFCGFYSPAFKDNRV